MNRMICLVFGLLLGGTPCLAQEVRVRDAASLQAAVGAAKPGTRILLAPGEYGSGHLFRNVRGEAGKPIVIEGADPKNPPRFTGGGGLQFSDPVYLELRHLSLSGARSNGLNIDDGGSYDTPAHHLVLDRLRVTDVGPQGNHDGIKLSGVTDFRAEGCVIERWGSGGSAIDMVGCHRGTIQGCRFREGGATGIQTKGGSSGITVRKNRFESAGERAVNIGGSTGLAYFRPKVQGYEARDIRVEGNVFTGSMAPIAFVGVDGATVRFNTFYRPEKWALRILQENTAPGFVPSRNGVFEDNIIVFRSSAWSEGGVNVGPGTAPGTFRFARNVWYAEDRPERSRPNLPVAESGGLVGQDPLLKDPGQGNFDLRPGSPAAGRGAGAFRQ